MFDLVFKNATVIDGSGSCAYTADVAVKKDRIAFIAKEGGLAGNKEINATKFVLSPGFIDFHSHSEWILDSDTQEDILNPFLLQGVTTFVGGNCGFSPYPVNANKNLLFENSRFLANDTFSFNWSSQKDFVDRISSKGILLNYIPLTGHGSLRTYIKGNDPSPLTTEESNQLKYLIKSAKKEGTYGISLGLAYVPGIFADNEELLTVFRAAVEEDLIVTIHGHTYSWISSFFEEQDDKSAVPHNVRDIKLFLELAKKTGARINLSHLLLKGVHTWNTCDQVISVIDEALKNDVDVTFGIIPYHCGNTLINTLLPKWFLENFSANLEDQNKINDLEREVELVEKTIGRTSKDLYLLWGGTEKLREYEGKSFQEIAKLLNFRDIETILWVTKESKGRAKILTATYSGEEGTEDTPLEELIKHEKAIIEIDTIITSHNEPQSPAAYGALPKVLGHFSREKRLFSLEKAVFKMTGFPAKRLGIEDLGIIKVGAIADLVLFNPKKIKDQNSMSHPGVPPIGIEQVWMKGKLVLEKGKRMSERLFGQVF